MRQSRPRRSHAATVAAAKYDAAQRRLNPSLAAVSPIEICYDAKTGRMVGGPFDGLEVNLVNVVEENATVVVSHADFSNGYMTVALCTDEPGEPEPTCCVDLKAMKIVCDDTSYHLHGAAVVAIAQEHPDGRITLSFVDPVDGIAKNGRFYPCESTPRTCCYDVASGKLSCTRGGSATDQLVSLLAMYPQSDGSIMAMVDAPGLPDDYKHLPVCGDDAPQGCCYDAANEALVCPSSDLDGTSAGIVSAWEVEGQIFVWAVWPGGGGRMPLCPGQTECPPVFCCINVQTFQYVCPGRPELNGQPAKIANLVIEDGYSWGILDDGTRIPMCGQDCPPPVTCPECPSCPRGLWMSPDGTCVDEPDCPDCPDCPDERGECPECPDCPDCPPCENCPRCPPGMLLDTATGRCVPCETRPPDEYCPYWWKLDGHCCENCALGQPCSGCDDCDDCGPSVPAAPLRPMTRLSNPGKYSVVRKTSKVVLGPAGTPTSVATDPGCPQGQVYCGSSRRGAPPICCDPAAIPPGYHIINRSRRKLMARIGQTLARAQEKVGLRSGNR